jgi:hypothetical protein
VCAGSGALSGTVMPSAPRSGSVGSGAATPEGPAGEAVTAGPAVLALSSLESIGAADRGAGTGG